MSVRQHALRIAVHRRLIAKVDPALIVHPFVHLGLGTKRRQPGQNGSPDQYLTDRMSGFPLQNRSPWQRFLCFPLTVF